jgi:dipeptidyl aminopeptidase/acylaminoacyl peptidase
VPRLIACAVALLLVVTGGLCPPLAKAQLQTVAEKTQYKATSKYADAVAFCEAVAKRGPVAKLSYFGTSQEDRKLPLLVVSDPPVATAQEAKEAGKLVVLAFANIHAGEVDGKEALLALARDLTDKKGHPLLKDLVILLVPILNADGNEKFATTNRPGQNGPAETGIRANAQGFDLNRDFVKLDSPEIRALVKLVNAWDPAMIIDCHTTNGSRHRYALTYDGSRYPTTDTEIALWSSGTLFPEVTRKVKTATGFDIAPYGNFNQDRTKWETYPATPRYGIQYFALRGRLGVLSESYSYASFADRVKVSHAFVTACLEIAASKKADILALVDPKQPSPATVAVRTQTVAFPEKSRILGFEEEVKDGKRITTTRPKDHSLDYVGCVKAVDVVQRPEGGYLIPADQTATIETLQRHGIKVEELREDIHLDVEVYRVDAANIATRAFQKRNAATVQVKKRTDTRRIPAGTILVRTAQPLGSLAAYLLEPQCEDGLTAWGFFNEQLKPAADFPVLRLPKAYPIATGSPAPLPENRVVNQPVTDALMFSPTGGFSFGLQGTPVNVGAWLDGDHFLQTKDGKLWKTHARTGKAEPFADPESIKTSLSAVKDLNANTIDRLSKGTFFRFNPDHTAFLFEIGPDLGVGYFDGRPAVRLTKSDGAKEYVLFSPDGKRVAFVRGGNLFVVDVEKPEERQLTHDGGGDILNAKADWVYEEEIFLRNGRAYWWSPDSKHLAFMRFDDTPVKRFNILNLSSAPRGVMETYPYPKVGDPNPTVKLGVVAASGGKIAFLDFGQHKPEDIIISRVGWMPDSKTVYAYVQDRLQTWLDFTTWQAADAKPKVLFRETTKAWVEDTGATEFLPDGSFLFSSDRSGWRHLYRYAADGKFLGTVTSGDWEVKSVLRADAKEVYFTAGFTSHTGTDMLRIALDGGKPELLTEKGKTHRVSLAPAGPLFIDRFTDPTTPQKASLMEVGKGEVRTLDNNPARERNQFKFGRHDRVKIPMKDGFELEATITYPPDFDEKKKHPVWLFTYAGPHAPTIRDDFSSGRVLDNSLATSGIIIFRVDPRSASGKGAQSAWACYKQLGVQELKDLEEAVAWLAKNEYVDKTRVGISGHSYGGFMAAYALTHSKSFSAGIASSAVTDWRLYDSIYTERYMLTPKENPDGYAKSSCVAAAKNLHGRLLIIHGMMDDNVHMQNSVQLADALQRANKEFEMMFYPQARHGIGGPHYTRLQNEFIRRTMGVAK